MNNNIIHKENDFEVEKLSSFGISASELAENLKVAFPSESKQCEKYKLCAPGEFFEMIEVCSICGKII